jgi:hypothetical protein
MPAGLPHPADSLNQHPIDSGIALESLSSDAALDPDKLERLGRYEVHLDRKLERMLAMLLRLKDLRQATVAG